MRWLLISLLGFWKGSWAVSNPHCLLMAEVRLCDATLPYESVLCCACLALEDAVPTTGCVGLCCVLVEPCSASECCRWGKRLLTCP